LSRLVTVTRKAHDVIGMSGHGRGCPMSNTETNTDQFWEYANEAILSASYAKSKEAEQGLFDFEHLPHSADSPPVIKVESLEQRTVESCERELIRRRRTEIQLREALAREEALLHQKDE